MIRLKVKPYIQPFERALALDELRALTGMTHPPEPSSEDGTYSVQGINAQALRRRLAYWEQVGAGQPTRQVLLEATMSVVRNGISLEEIQRVVPLSKDSPLPNRRVLRYGVHGAHEYRGKFFPQLVSALINSATSKRSALVADPMCGSGTTLVQAVDAGFRTIGADVNPMSVFMTRTKVAALSIDPKSLRDAYATLCDILLRRPCDTVGDTYLNTLPDRDQAYLRDWIASDALRSLDRIMRVVNQVGDPRLRDLFRLSLSNIIRPISWQKNDDLRVRREPRADQDVDVVEAFLSEVGRTVRLIYAYLLQRGGKALGRARILELDAKEAFPTLERYRGRVQALITSPPYATALPYLDTDRLSLAYLGLLSRAEHRTRDRQMIGNREVTEVERKAYWEDLIAKSDQLPPGVVTLINTIADRNANHASTGFRRRNLPALLGRYFLDMQRVLANSRDLLAADGRAFFVVGSNSTIAGGEQVTIDTAGLLGEIGHSTGLRLVGSRPMDMLVSRDIFRRNSSDAETILCFSKN